MPTLAPEPGGDTEYSASYVPLSNAEGVELQGVTDVIDVIEQTNQALPSNVIYTLRFKPEAYVPSLVDSLSRQFAGYFNALAAIPNVSAVSTFQNIDDADQIQDVMRIVVRSTSGNFSASIDEQQFGRQVALVAEEVAAKVKELDKIEAGS